MCGIYKITNTITNKMYIGKTKGKFKKRWYRHRYELNKGISPCSYLQNTWNKHGEENFKFEVIAEGDFNQAELKQLEEIFIKLYGYYNILMISHSHTYSEERRRKASKVFKDLWKDSEYKKKKAKQSRAKWANPEWRKRQIAAMTTDAWNLYPQVVEYWRNKANGRGGNAHPGISKIQVKFNLSKSITERMLTRIKQDSNIKIMEGYNKEEIYKYWLNPINANQAKYKHPGRRDIAKTFNISEHLALDLIKEFMKL